MGTNDDGQRQIKRAATKSPSENTCESNNLPNALVRQEEREDREEMKPMNEDHQGKENNNFENSLYKSHCFGCHKSLSKSRQLINISGRLHKWHPECFKCNVCNHPLDRETSCHVYKDKIVCREDYARLQRNNTVNCSRCQWPIGASDWVRKAGPYVYHLACFSCDICLRQLSTGEQFTIRNQEKATVKLLCRLHFAIASGTSNQRGSEQTVSSSTSKSDNVTATCQQQQQQSSSGTSDDDADKNQQQSLDQAYNFEFAYERSPAIVTGKFQSQLPTNYLHLLPSSQSMGIPSSSDGQISPERKRQAAEFEQELGDGSLVQGRLHEADRRCGKQLSIDCEGQHMVNSAQRASGGGAASSSSSSGSISGLMSMPSKSKRVRTTFTEDQLSILQTHFQIDSNPDGQDLERIATITGLSKRVTQVWFQNSRARQKKYMIKRKPSNCSSTSAGGAPITNAIASNVSLPPCGQSNLQQISLGIFNSHHHHQQQQARGETSSGSGDFYHHHHPILQQHSHTSQYHNQQQQNPSTGGCHSNSKWPSNLSEQSEVSSDDVLSGAVDIDGSRSSDDSNSSGSGSGSAADSDSVICGSAIGDEAKSGGNFVNDNDDVGNSNDDQIQHGECNEQVAGKMSD